MSYNYDSSAKNSHDKQTALIWCRAKKKSNYSKSFYAVPKLWRFGKHLWEQITLLATGHGIKADDI